MEYSKLSDYKELNFKEIEELWKENTRPTVLYINTPFCKYGNCKYCFHKGFPMNENSNTVDIFFNQYMKDLLDKYENIINTQDIKMVSFGGGTPNFLPPERIDKYLGKFLSFGNLLNK